MQRRTTPAFELATSVLFLSGIQHYAESPEGMAHVPEDIVDFLRALPDYWDDVRFISGFPGKDVAIARRAGSRWYIAGINGEDVAKRIDIDLSRFEGVTSAKLITDGDEIGTFEQAVIPISGSHPVVLRPNGGFVVVME